MTTIILATQARHQQAIATREAAEAELIAAMKAIEPSFTGYVTAMQDRRWEARLEGRQPFWELAQAFGTYRRAQRSEAKARSSAYLAKWAAVPAAPPAPPTPRRRKATRKATFADQARASWAEEAEARAA